MTPAFISPAALPSNRAASTRCDGATQPRRTSRTVVCMAEAKKPKSFREWLYSKLMHNAQWEGDENHGYELFFKEAMTARDEEKKRKYREQDQQRRS